MSSSNPADALRIAFGLLAAVAAALVGGCATDGGGSASVGVGVSYGYGVYYGSACCYDNWYGGGSIDVGPPDARPPSTPGGGRPPHVSNLPSRPMPPSRPAGGGGRRR